MDTIAAIATPSGIPGAISMVRLSGSNAWLIAQTLLKQQKPFEAGKITRGWIHAPEASSGATQKHAHALIDEVIVLPYRAPASYTGEDVIEFCGHGGVWVTQCILDACLNAGARLAYPGEFTQRALINGKLDLTQAESVLDIIHAQGDALLMAATENLRYRTLAKAIERLAIKITSLQGQIVANIDFPDEVDEPDRGRLLAHTREILQDIEQLVASSQRGFLLRNGIRVALLGQPNAGKSSLFNALLSEDRAIVTPIAGTTRDTINETLTIAGITVTLIDTAGLRDSDEAIEKIGIERSWQAASEADLWLYVVDATACKNNHLNDLDSETLQTLHALKPQTPTLIVMNQVDRLSTPMACQTVSMPDEAIQLSATTGEGLGQVQTWICKHLELLLTENSSPLEADATSELNRRQARLCLTQRQSDTLRRAQTALLQAEHTLAEFSLPLDIVTVSFSEGLHALGALLGTDSVEAVLDDVFSKFCVGK
ncbi:MAG: tRNA uridine-5-carboxymethylaminomethyl(34) synthesis GTPase MnmE [Vampirovibrionales bacterium]|nr:tRNA uridine-5-carboxymethylaminomethyl(34) synthesis GTPase MnmE [Vampirovibrionales bacterium]